jgi:hypothetical protein
MESPTIKIVGLALSLLFLRFLRDLPFRLPPQANLNTGSKDLGAFIVTGVAPRSTLIQLCTKLGPAIHTEPSMCPKGPAVLVQDYSARVNFIWVKIYWGGVNHFA